MHAFKAFRVFKKMSKGLQRISKFSRDCKRFQEVLFDFRRFLLTKFLKKIVKSFYKFQDHVWDFKVFKKISRHFPDLRDFIAKRF